MRHYFSHPKIKNKDPPPKLTLLLKRGLGKYSFCCSLDESRFGREVCRFMKRGGGGRASCLVSTGVSRGMRAKR